MDKIYQTYLKIIGVILSLYLFLVGIKGLSSVIKHMGGDFAKNIMTTTSDPFLALFIGILATTLFQSSSTTTSIIVGMVFVCIFICVCVFSEQQEYIFLK